jgi:hypothetical protein
VNWSRKKGLERELSEPKRNGSQSSEHALPICSLQCSIALELCMRKTHADLAISSSRGLHCSSASVQPCMHACLPWEPLAHAMNITYTTHVTTEEHMYNMYACMCTYACFRMGHMHAQHMSQSGACMSMLHMYSQVTYMICVRALAYMHEHR